MPLTGAHRALHDAEATAHLLVQVCKSCPPGGPVAVTSGLPRSGRVLRREDTAPVALPDPPLIAYLASRLSHGGVEADLLAYLELVDRCIGDLHLDPAERSLLADLAHQLGLSDAQIALGHRRFVNELIDAALDDHQVTPDEYDLLVRAAAALGVDQGVVEQRTRPARAAAASVVMGPGLKVVFTGDRPDHPREDLVGHARHLGMEVLAGVTKATELLVAADPESNSGKAGKARRYGIPVLDAAAFARARPGEVLEASGSSVEQLKVVTCPDCLATWTVPAASGAQRSRRCDDCGPVRATPPRRSSPAAVPAVEVLACEACGQSWERRRVRGRKPTRCPACAG